MTFNSHDVSILYDFLTNILKTKDRIKTATTLSIIFIYTIFLYFFVLPKVYYFQVVFTLCVLSYRE